MDKRRKPKIRGRLDVTFEALKYLFGIDIRTAEVKNDQEIVSFYHDIDDKNLGGGFKIFESQTSPRVLFTSNNISDLPQYLEKKRILEEANKENKEENNISTANDSDYPSASHGLVDGETIISTGFTEDSYNGEIIVNNEKLYQIKLLKGQ